MNEQDKPKAFISGEMIQWTLKHKLIVRNGLEHWRWINKPMVRPITGLPHSFGRAMITNGILVYIELGNDSLYVGHWSDDLVEGMKTISKAAKSVHNISEYF